MNDGFRIRRGLKDRALAHQFLAQRARIGEIAVMGHGQPSSGEIGVKRLYVAQHGFSRR